LPLIFQKNEILAEINIDRGKMEKIIRKVANRGKEFYLRSLNSKKTSNTRTILMITNEIEEFYRTSEQDLTSLSPPTLTLMIMTERKRDFANVLISLAKLKNVSPWVKKIRVGRVSFEEARLDEKIPKDLANIVGSFLSGKKIGEKFGVTLFSPEVESVISLFEKNPVRLSEYLIDPKKNKFVIADESCDSVGAEIFVI
jgi:hypothetical protein